MTQSAAHGGYTLRIGSELRGVVPAFALGVGTYTLCYVEERVEGTVHLKPGGGASCSYNSNGVSKWLNPPIEFVTART